jgi:hypothetical protein
MVDFVSGAWAGFCTGMGVIFAQKFITWFESHPLTREVKEIFNGKPPKRYR